jgi:uncharacterized membrane protein YebE (DUF533 family)
MFDARSILDMLVRGGGQPPGSGSSPGQGGDAFRDLLGQLGNQPGAQGGNALPPQGRVPTGDPQAMPRSGYQDDRRDAPPNQGGQSLEDLLRSVLGGGEQPGQAPRGSSQSGAPGGGGLEDLLRNVLGGGQQAGPPPGGGARSGPGGGNLQDMLRDLLGGGGPGGSMNRMVGDGGGQGGQGQGGQGNVLDVLKQVLGQATSGVREGAGRLDEATGASGRARDAIGQATGQSPEELIARLKDLIANNKVGAGAALGGLGALILGTGAGRALAGSAVRLGGLALIGGLAYKAYQNYQQGLPPLSGAKPPSQQGLVAAPAGSGFEPEAVTHESATLYIRAMIAAAAADGRIDASEQQKIMGGLQQAGMNADAKHFLTREINNPATVEDLATAVSSQEDAVQTYTAARLAVDVDSDAEHEFLGRLAHALGIDDDLAAQVDAAARGTAA